MTARTEDEVHNQKVILGITTTLLVLCYTFYFLRILSRKLLQTPLWVDDWFMFFALGVCSGMSLLNYVEELRYGSGVHRHHLTDAEYRKFQITLYIFMMFWALGVCVVKIGILLFYWRIFITRSFRRRVATVGALILTSGTALFVSFVFQCIPIPRFWADTNEGHCINQVAFYISGGSINIVSDVLVLSTPVMQVWRLKASTGHRLALLFLFSLGGFVCITSIIRLTALNEIDPEDFAYTNVGGGLWSTAEVQLGFICANLPHTRSLFLRWSSYWLPSISLFHSGGDHHSHRNSTLAQSRSRRDTTGFHSLDSQSKSIAAAAEPIGAEETSPHLDEADTRSLEANRGFMVNGALAEPAVGRVKVKTELRQETQPIEEGSLGSLRPTGWGNDTVMTEITARGS